MGKMTNEESLGTLRMAPGETQRGPIDTSAKPWYRKWPWQQGGEESFLEQIKAKKQERACSFLPMATPPPRGIPRISKGVYTEKGNLFFFSFLCHMASIIGKAVIWSAGPRAK